jgi:hypothetical protein
MPPNLKHHVKWNCFVWPANLDCGKASPLLTLGTRLRKDTRRTLSIQHEGCGGPMNAGYAQSLRNYSRLT